MKISVSTLMLSEALSRLAILFLIFSVISSSFVVNVGMSCQMQDFLGKNMWGMHAIGWLTTFVFLCLEGGMSFNPSVDKQAPTDWTRANMVSTAAIAAIIYGIFVLSSKMQLLPNMMFFGTLMALYMLITHKRFLSDRKKITPEQEKTLQGIVQFLVVVLITIGVYGVVDYVGYQQMKHRNDFSWMHFFVGSKQCARMK